ncbi:MAG: hypothetical protein CME72_12300 [Halomonadaceae bacterium]|nr:hypothetical protein [Halomonadaceae bacterium]
MYDQLYFYAFEVTKKEKPKFERLIWQDESRTLYGVLAGLASTVIVFLAQWPWAGEPHFIHFYCSYGALPIGFLVGAWVRFRVPRWTYRTWMRKWHPVIKERRAARGWDTDPPEPPEDFLDYVNRRWIELDRPGCTQVAFLLAVLAICLTMPIVADVEWFKWVWVVQFGIAWPGCLFVGDSLANAYAKR